MNVKLLMAQHQTCSDIYVLLMLKNIRQKKSLEAQGIGKNTNRLTNYYSKVGAWKPDSPNVVSLERKIIKFFIATNQSHSVIEIK